MTASTGAAATPAQAPADDVARIKAAIDRDWIAESAASGYVVVRSPAYARPLGEGCVIHTLSFLRSGDEASLGDMVSTDRYYPFAAGEQCASVDPAKFFEIEPGNDVPSLLAFARRLEQGPRPGRDRIPAADRERMAACFTAEAMRTTRVLRAHSWRPRGEADHYQVTFACDALGDDGDLVAIGVRGSEAVRWQVAALGRVDLELRR